MGDNKTTGAEVKDSQDRTFVMERVFDAPRERVFKAWSEPERLAQWWGPRGFTTTIYRMEFRPGGVWHYCMRGHAMEAWGLARFQEIVEPERIVYIDNFSDEAGNLAPGMPEMVITIDFADLGGKTKLISRALFATITDLENTLKMGMTQGLSETWDRLAEFLVADQFANV